MNYDGADSSVTLIEGTKTEHCETASEAFLHSLDESLLIHGNPWYTVGENGKVVLNAARGHGSLCSQMYPHSSFVSNTLTLRPEPVSPKLFSNTLCPDFMLSTEEEKSLNPKTPRPKIKKRILESIHREHHSLVICRPLTSSRLLACCNFRALRYLGV